MECALALNGWLRETECEEADQMGEQVKNSASGWLSRAAGRSAPVRSLAKAKRPRAVPGNHIRAPQGAAPYWNSPQKNLVPYPES